MTPSFSGKVSSAPTHGLLRRILLAAANEDARRYLSISRCLSIYLSLSLSLSIYIYIYIYRSGGCAPADNWFSDKLT